MRNTLFYTTMTNHRPLGHTVVGRYPVSAVGAEPAEPRQFRATAARDSIDTNQNQNPNIPAQPALRDLLARSTQPIFSVSAMFRIRSGGGCGSCGH